MHTAISDIFFNQDNGSAWIDGDWDHETLTDYAIELIDNLGSLGVSDLPSPQQLVADFIDRV